MFGRKKKVVKSEPDVVRHGKAYPVITVDIDNTDAYSELFKNWINSSGITSITVRSPFDPYERGDMGLLARQGDDISHESYNMASAKINAELSNIMFRIIGARYRTSILIDNGYWVGSMPNPSFRINHDEYVYHNMAKVRHGDGDYLYWLFQCDYLYWLSQCDDAPGNDALDVFERTELGKAMTWFMEASPEERKPYADIITWVGPDVDPVAFLTGDGTNAAPARLIERADILVEHMEKIRGTLTTVPDDIMATVDKYFGTARSALTIIHSPATTPSASRSWNDLLDIIEHSMMAVDALAMTVMTSNLAQSNKQLDMAFASAIHDIELMDGEHAAKPNRRHVP
jgi:hypothetical protein